MKDNLDYVELNRQFNENNFVLVKGIIDKDTLKFIWNYCKIRHNRAKYFYDIDWSYTRIDDGVFNDAQVPNTYSCYGDPLMESLLFTLKPDISKIMGLDLAEQYSYWRLYKKGDDLKRHKDRVSCEYSITMCLGYSKEGDSWPMFVDPSLSGESTKNGYVSENKPGVGIHMQPGDLIAYKGCVLEHWREPFEGDFMAQVFLHYNDKNGQYGKNKFDSRPMLGLPSDFKKK
jgi:hypothetical protein